MTDHQDLAKTPAKRRWYEQTDSDYSYWLRHLKGSHYHAIRADSDPDSDDEYGDPTRWFVGLRAIDIDEIETEAVASFVGFQRDDTGWFLPGWAEAEPIDGMQWAEAAVSYGNSAPLRDVTVPTRKLSKTIRKMMRLSAALESDAAALETLMERPVNAIGSTARELARGDIYTALHRGVAEGNPDALLITKIYHAADGNTLGAGNVKHLLPELPLEGSDG